jgi:hypothetical protein
MKPLTVEIRVPRPRLEVFTSYRDQMARVLEFLPNVRAIDISRREEEGSIVQQSSEWHGGGEVPAAVRGIVTQSMLTWTDHAKWDGAAFLCDWRAVARSFPEGVRCRGRTSFREVPDGHTLIEVRGAVEVDGRRLPGVPGFLAGPVGRSVEEFLVDRIRANLAETTKWFEKYATPQSEAG